MSMVAWPRSSWTASSATSRVTREDAKAFRRSCVVTRDELRQPCPDDASPRTGLIRGRGSPLGALVGLVSPSGAVVDRPVDVVDEAANSNRAEGANRATTPRPAGDAGSDEPGHEWPTGSFAWHWPSLRDSASGWAHTAHNGSETRAIRRSVPSGMSDSIDAFHSVSTKPDQAQGQKRTGKVRGCRYGFPLPRSGSLDPPDRGCA
jgi:hypothetical protein